MLRICGVVNLHANPHGESSGMSPTSYMATKWKKITKYSLNINIVRCEHYSFPTLSEIETNILKLYCIC